MHTDPHDDGFERPGRLPHEIEQGLVDASHVDNAARPDDPTDDAAHEHPAVAPVTRLDLDALVAWLENMRTAQNQWGGYDAGRRYGEAAAALAAERARADQAEQRRDEAQKEVQWWEDWENKVIWHLHPNWEDDIAQIALLTNFIEHAAKLDSVIENAREADGYEGNALTFVWDDDTRTLSAAPTAEQGSDA